MSRIHQVTLELHLQDAKRLADTDGTLPRPEILIANGYGALYKYMRRHPEKFKRFRCAKKMY